MKVLLIQKMAGIAGSENYLLNLLPGLIARGVEAHFLCVQEPGNASKNQAFVQTLEDVGVKVHIINTRVSLSFKLMRSIHRLVDEERYDIVQTNLIHADVWGAIIKQFLMPGLALVSVKHGYADRFQKQYGLDPSFVGPDRFSILTRWAGRRADRIVTISEGLKRFLVASGLAAPGRCQVIPYGIALEAGSGLESPVSVRYGEPQLVIIGRLVAVKQHRLVLNILPELVRRFPGLKLVIVGAGPLESELKARAKEQGIAQHVIWAGFRKNIGDYLRASDVLVLPSVAEGFGLVILEAWLNQVPVAAFDVPAPNEIIRDGETGVLAPPFDTAVMLEKLSQLLAHPEDAKAMGERGHAVYKARYTLDAMLDATIELYRGVLTGRARAVI